MPKEDRTKGIGFDDEIQKLQLINEQLREAGLSDDQVMALMKVIGSQRAEMYHALETMYRSNAKSYRLFLIALVIFGLYSLLELVNLLRYLF